MSELSLIAFIYLLVYSFGGNNFSMIYLESWIKVVIWMTLVGLGLHP